MFVSLRKKRIFFQEVIAIFVLLLCFALPVSAARDFKVQSTAGIPFFFIEGDNGRVGISTISPATKLDVNGNIQSAYYFDRDDSNYYLNPAAGGTGYSLYSSGSIYASGVDDNYFAGNVGIGTTTPSTTLQVDGDVTATTFYGNLAGYATSSGSADHATYANSALSSLYLGDSFNLTADAQGNLQVDGTGDSYFMGNLGIGTTTPQDDLHVQGNVTVTGLGSCSASDAVVRTDGSSRLVCGSITGTGGVMGTGTQNYITKWNNASGTSIGNSVIYDDGTNVGIGTTSPASKLHIDDGLVSVLKSSDGTYQTPTQDYHLTPKGYVDGAITSGDADLLDSIDSLQFLRSDTTDSYTSGTLTFNSGTELDIAFGSTLDINGNLSIADTDIALDGASTNFLSTGNFSINTNDFYIQKSTGYVGIGTADPQQELHIQGDLIGSVYYDLVDSNYYLDPGARTYSYGLYSKGSVYSEGSADNYFAGNVGIGVTDPDTILTIANDNWISAKDNTGTSYVNMFKVNASDEIDVGATLNIGPIELAEDSGAITLVNLPVSSTPNDGDTESYGFSIDSNPVLTIYGLADGSGGTDTHRVGIGTTSPQSRLHVQTASDVEIFRTEDETGSEAMVIDKDGNVIISL